MNRSLLNSSLFSIIFLIRNMRSRHPTLLCNIQCLLLGRNVAHSWGLVFPHLLHCSCYFISYDMFCHFFISVLHRLSNIPISLIVFSASTSSALFSSCSKWSCRLDINSSLSAITHSYTLSNTGSKVVVAFSDPQLVYMLKQCLYCCLCYKLVPCLS